MAGTVRDLLSYRLARVAGLNDRSGHAHLAEAFAVTLSEWRIFGNIKALAPVMLADLSRSMLIDKGQLSRTVSGLIARGWVASTASKFDRRTILLTLTPAGKAEHDRILTFAAARNRTMLSVLEPAERHTLVRLLAKLEAFVETEHAALALGSASQAELTARRAITESAS